MINISIFINMASWYVLICINTYIYIYIYIFIYTNNTIFVNISKINTTE